MNNLLTYKLYILLILLITVYNNAICQVTVGSDEMPIGGAILQLKNIRAVDKGANSTKGLGLPRVEINDLAKLQLGDADELVGEEREKHIGLVVYNVKNIGIGENRIRSGIHVWTGEDWQTLTPYAEETGTPTVIDVQKEIISKILHEDPINYPIGALGKYTDTRGVSGEEVNEYYMARFYVAKVKEKVTTTYQSPSSAATWTETEEVERIEDGVWMTENMRSKIAPNAAHTPIPHDPTNKVGDGYNLAVYVHPDYNIASPAVEGLLYNWAAATVGEDGVHGKGGISGKESVEDERNIHLYPVQGICPDGWHFASLKDYDMLRDAMIANPAYYSTDATLTAENIGKAFKHPDELYLEGIENKGTSKPASDGGFAALLVVGWGNNAVGEYGWALHTWTSSAIKVGGVLGSSAGQYSLYPESSWVGYISSYRHGYATVRCMKY